MNKTNWLKSAHIIALHSPITSGRIRRVVISIIRLWKYEVIWWM